MLPTGITEIKSQPTLIRGLYGYEIEQVCWERPHAIVYRALRKIDALPLLVKLLRDPGSADWRADWFQRDYQIAQGLSLDCALKPLAFEQTDRGPALIYADACACPLEEASAKAPLSIETALTIGASLAEAVAALHKERLLHCNLNTTTVWLRDNNKVLISDFGCARRLAGEIASEQPPCDDLINVRYMSPEQTGRVQNIIDHRTDIYSLGVILYRLLTGTLPFDGTDLVQIIDGHVARQPVFPAELDLPKGLAEVVLKALSKDPDARYLSASGLVSDLLECRAQWCSTGTIDGFEPGRYDAKAMLRVSRRLYGRERETATLLDKARSARGGRPAWLLVKGAPGVGKSTLVAQLEDSVRKQKGRFAAGKFDQYKRNVPYLALAQAFQQLIGQLISGSKTELDIWRSRVLDALGANARVVIDVIPEVELITGPQPPVPSLPPTQARNRFNLAFTRLIQAFAPRGELLCVFMDDLQWVDRGSLALLAQILSDPETKNILFVGAYRTKEVDAGHPLEATLGELKGAGTDVEFVDLNELQEPDLRQLVCETFGISQGESRELAEVLHRKSGGNPLFLTQFLPYLCDEGLVAFDHGRGRWVWDLARIEREGVTEDILDLLNKRLAGLHEDTRTILATAACLGSAFDVTKLTLAADRSRAEVLQCMSIGVREGLVITLEGRGADPEPKLSLGSQVVERYRFLHDRIQQAAFGCIAKGATREFRLQVGRRLMAALGPDDELLPQLDVLSNLNAASELITDEGERLSVAHLNLVAGRRARQALAYSDALGYLAVGLRLLGKRVWHTDYELALELYSETFECEYLTANFARADELFNALIANARSKLEKARLYRTKILLETSEEHYEEAIATGVTALKILGVYYLKRPSKLLLLAQFLLVRLRMQMRTPQDLLAAKELDDPEKIAAVRILVTLIVPAYLLRPELWMFTTFKVVNISLRDGISPASALGFASYGTALGAVLGDAKRGYAFGRLGLDLAERSNDPSVTCNVLHIFTSFIKPSRDPLEECFPLWHRIQQLSLEVGEHSFCNYAILSELLARATRGSDLNEVLRLFEEKSSFVLQSNEPFAFDFLTMANNFALALQGRTADPCSLNTDGYNEAAAEVRYRKSGNLFTVFYQYFLRLKLACLFGRYEALDLSEKCDAVVRRIAGTVHVPEHYFYRGLALAVVLGRPGNGSRHHRRKLRGCLARLKVAASNCPHNFAPHAALLQAEAVRLTGRFADALKQYNRSIELAESEGHTHIVGLAHERATLLCLAEGERRLASWYLAGARAAYEKWGAPAKVAWLDREYATLLAANLLPVSPTYIPPRTSDGAAPTPAHTSQGERFDIAAALHASRIIASGENAEGVLTHLMQVIRVQAGGETAHLLVLEGGKLRLEASATVDSGGLVLFRSNDAGSGSFSPAVVNYVLHTGEDLLVADAGTDGRFVQCSYVAGRRPKSVLCCPIRHHGEVLGVIYLEHTGIAGSFTGEKVQWLQLLATEVGLTVWSARLSRYRNYVHKFAPANVAKEIDANPASPNLEARDCNVSILFGDLAGYTRMAEQMERRQLDELINRVFSRFIDEIHRYEGTLLEIRGDEIFVLFGDDDPSRHVWKAASAALAISRAAAALKDELSSCYPPVILNMGINSGMASVGLKSVEASSGSRWRYGASGTVVNIAARVRELARDGSILMSADSAARVQNDFEFEDVGEHALKNVNNPVRIYRLIGEHGI
jgi:predicted ATPase/class 3 adenylate cyclase